MKITLYRSNRNQSWNILAVSDFDFLNILVTWPLVLFFWRVTLTFSPSKVDIFPDRDLSLINFLSYGIIKKWLSSYFDLRSGHFCGMACLRMHLPIISQWQKYRLPSKPIWPVQILQSHAGEGYYWWLRCSCASVTRWRVIRGHTVTLRDKYSLFPISIFDRMAIETCDSTNEFDLAKHIMWYATRYVWVVSWPWPWVKFQSNFKVDLTM